MIACCRSCASRDREPPVLADGDHVAHVEVVRHDPGPVEQREAQVEQLRRRVSLTPRMQHALVAHVAHAGLEHRRGRLGHQRGDRLRGVDVGVDGELDAARAGGGRPAAPCPPGPRPAASAAAGPSAPWWPAGCRGCCRSRAARRRTPPGAATACWRRRRRRPRRRARRACGAGSRASRPSRSTGLRSNFSFAITGGGVADQVHPGAVPAVLRAGGQQLGEHLGGVAVGQALDDPHLVLVQRVAGGVRVARPVGAPVAEHRQHVAADRVGVERLGEAAPASAGVDAGAIVFSICGGTSIDMVARSAWSRSRSA